MPNIKTHLLTLVLIIYNFVVFSQTDESMPRKQDYLSAQTGLIVDAYSTVGVRTFFEYQKDLKNNWQYGISYEHTRRLGNFLTHRSDNLDTNLSLLSLNGYYKVKLIKDKVFWTGGVGIGAVHINWDNKDRFGATVNASITLNIKVSKRLYIETAPLAFILPVNRGYYSPMNVENFDNFYAVTALPVGIKVRL